MNSRNLKVALITGITGQDGAYLAKFLLEKGYQVHGIKRRTSIINTSRIDNLYNNSNLTLHYGDLADSNCITRLIKEIQPDEIYNLGAMSHVKVSFEEPEYTADIDGLGILRILEAVRILGLENKTKIYQASSSEMYGKVQEVPQTETTPFYPRSPYAIAKVFAYWTCINYREAYNMFVCNGILFNHESPHRGETFVTRKISIGVSKIVLGLQDKLYLGNLNSVRDWGYAQDYIEAMWLMLQNTVPDDYVIATGEIHSVRDFVIYAFKILGTEIEFKGSELNEVGIVTKSNTLPIGKEIVAIDSKYFRPTEVPLLCGDSSKAREKLGWKPTYNFTQLVVDMVITDYSYFLKTL